jgi:hypothetical protein
MFRTLLERLGFSRQLGLIVAFFALTIVCLLGLVGAAFHVMSGVRAYVGGEGLWSKSQKAAVRALEHAIDGDDQALVYFDAIIAVPLGDRRARGSSRGRIPIRWSCPRGSSRAATIPPTSRP